MTGGDRDGVDLVRGLPDLQVSELQRIARRFVLDRRATARKADLCEAITETLASAELLDAVIARLAPLERELLAEVARRGGAADAWELATHLALRGFEPPPIERRWDSFHRWLGRSGAAAYLTPLVDDGVLVRAGRRAAPRSVDAFDEGWVGVDPRLLARLPSGRPAPLAPLDLPAPAEPGAAPGAPPSVAAHPIAVLLETLDAAFLALDLGGVPVTRVGAIARPFVARAQRERPRWAERMEPLLHTLFALRLLRPPHDPAATGPAHPWRVDREELAALLRLPPAYAYAAIVDAACGVEDGAVGERWSGGLYGDAPARSLRRAVFDALPALPAHPVELGAAAAALWDGPLVRVFGWADRVGGAGDYGRRRPREVAAVLAHTCVRLGLVALNGAPPDFDARPDLGAPMVRAAGPESGGDPSVRVGAPSIAPTLGGRWYAVARARVLGHAGVEDLEGDLTPWSAVHASTPVGGSDTATSALVVQPNFEVLVYLDRVGADALAALTCARAVRIDPHTATFEIDRRSVGRALDLGRGVAEVIAGLRTHAGVVPDNVERAIHDWTARRDRLRVTLDARIVEFADAAARDAALPRLAGARGLGERFAVVPPRAKAPAVDRHRYRDTAERRITIERSGALRVEGALDLAGRAVVHALTRRGAGGRLELDPDAIRAGRLPGGWRDVLEARLAAPVPAHVDALLRAWGGDGPTPALQSAVLFRHPKASAWAQHPRLAPHLTAALNDGTYLVAPASVAPLTAALRGLGLAIDMPDAPSAAGVPWAHEPEAASGIEPVDRLVAGLSTRRVRERLEEAIAAGHHVELRYVPERERAGRYGRVHRARGRVRTARFEPLLVRYLGSLPYLHARPLAGDGEEELVRIGYIEAIAVLA